MRPSHLIPEAGAESGARLVLLLLLLLLFLFYLEEVDGVLESEGRRLLMRDHMHPQGIPDLRIGASRELLLFLICQGLVVFV